MTERFQLTSKAEQLFNGPDDPEHNPARFPHCRECGEVVDLLGNEGLWVEAGQFWHKVCPAPPSPPQERSE